MDKWKIVNQGPAIQSFLRKSAKFVDMLKKLCLILFLLNDVFLFAQSEQNLIVLSEDGKKFTMYLNDEKVNTEPEAEVKVFGISHGVQKIKIEFEDGKMILDSIRIKPIEKNNYKEFTYAIRHVTKGGSTRQELVFISTTDTSGPKVPVVPAPPVFVVVKDNKLYGNLYQAKDDKPIFFKNYNEETKTCVVKLNDTEIQYAIDLVKKTNDFEYRHKYIEATVMNNCYSTSQIITLITMTDTEMDKLKLCKEAYSHLTDPANGYKLAEALKYSSFKDDYSNFLREKSNSKKQESLKCTIPISEIDFNVILGKIQKTPYEYDKLKVAKKEAVNNCMSTDQVKRIVKIFTHDRERLEFCKSAYRVVTDKANFSSLEDCFQFSESKSDFIKFLSK